MKKMKALIICAIVTVSTIITALPSKADEIKPLASGEQMQPKDPYCYDDTDLYPYPKSYMKKHKIKVYMENPEEENGKDNIRLGSTCILNRESAYDQINYEAMMGLDLKVINNNRLSIRYYDHTGVDGIMNVELGNEKFDLKYNETVTKELKGNEITIRGTLKSNPKHAVRGHIRKIGNTYKLFGTEIKAHSIDNDAIDHTSKEVTSNKGLTYPSSGKYGRCVHVRLWEKKQTNLSLKKDCPMSLSYISSLTILFRTVPLTNGAMVEELLKCLGNRAMVIKKTAISSITQT